MLRIKNIIYETLSTRQFWLFALVGVANTAVDFALLNVLTKSFGWPTISANIVSTTVALALSFTLNSKGVFPDGSASRKKQALLFIAVTLFGLYVIQSLVIWFLTQLWTWPADALVRLTGLDMSLVYVNFSKIVASAFTMVWNFAMYKKVVFK